MLTTFIHRFDLPAEPSEGFQSFPAFAGATPNVRFIGCHASLLGPGRSPHPPHAHDDEEILIPLRGEAEVLIATAPDDPAPRVETLRPGSFIYYPAGQHHTIRNSGRDPIAYLMFKWQAPVRVAAERLDTTVCRFGDLQPPVAVSPFSGHLLLNGATAMLATLHAHLSIVQPGGGYAPHRDRHDVALVLLSGAIEVLGRRLEPLSVVFCPAGEPHGLRSVGDEAARYLAIEFHADGVDPLHDVPWPSRLAMKLRARARRTLPDVVVRLLRRLLRR